MEENEDTRILAKLEHIMKKKVERDKEIARLQSRLNQLTGNAND